VIFNSGAFIFFLGLVFFIHWFVLKRKQNELLLCSSYIFYSFWDWRFTFLLLCSTIIDFYLGKQIYHSDNRRFFLGVSIIVNLSILVFFKYFNFFNSSTAAVFSYFGLQYDVLLIDIILPVGISFYTFHGMSYVFDIYRQKINPSSSLVEYSLFVSFFPLLVAGPIERADHLLPQLTKPRVFEHKQGVDGLRLILWGMFKKVVIADSLASLSDHIFSNYQMLSGSELALGVLYFSVQIYADFSGYTDIAIGVAKLFGIELLTNFKFPYFAPNIQQFWKRWHISLTSWFRDYLYIPIGGGRSKAKRNVIIVFLVSGFWHGANWTFIAWGLIHALFFIFIKRNIGVVLTFCLISFAWIFFRSPSLFDALAFIKRLPINFFNMPAYKSGFVYIITLMCFDATFKDSRTVLNYSNKYVRWFIYLMLSFAILLFFDKPSTFIYFQF
jgi:alginate O-acetyltransferase complex protein AlgI